MVYRVRGRHVYPAARHRRPLVLSHLLLQRPRKRVWQVMTSGLSVLALLAVCGLSSYFIVADERQGRDAHASGTEPTQAAVFRDISSREADPAPLTPAEVFPGREVRIIPAEPPYRVLKTHVTGRCLAAASGAIGALLDELGCSQVVRGTLRSPTGAYLITAGVFNLGDMTGAEWAHERIKPLVDGEQGRFAGMVAGRGTEAIALSSAQVGWHVRGHYLVYCVIARTDGRTISKRDAYAQRILFDMLELHLRGTVLAKRATASAS